MLNFVIFKMLDFFFIFDLNDSFSKKLIFEQVINFFFIFCILNFFSWSTVVELIWPTHFFNRRHSSSFNFLRFRSFTEYLLKCSSYSDIFFLLNKFFFLQKLILKN